MGDTKIAALIFIFLGAFFLWLHSQGKLIPLFQQVFGVGLYGQKAKAAQIVSSAPTSTSAPTSAAGTLPGVIGQILQGSPKTGAGTQYPPQKIDPAHDITGTLPGW